MPWPRSRTSTWSVFTLRRPTRLRTQATPRPRSRPSTDRPPHCRPGPGALQAYGEFRLLVTPDHPTPLRTKTHSHGDVPFALAGTGIQPDAAAIRRPHRRALAARVPEGWRLMGYF